MTAEYKEREKPTWAERDKNRGRSSQRREEKKRDDPRTQRAMKKYKKKLDAMFTVGEKLTEEQSGQLREMQDAPDRDAFVVLADAYIQVHGLPQAWGTLSIFLRHRDPKVLIDVIERLEKLMSGQSDVARGNFSKDLSAIEMTTRDKDLRRVAVRVQAAVEGPAT